MKYIILLISISISISIFFSCSFFAVGSYPYAEYYKFELSRDSLINKMSLLKEKELYDIDQNNGIKNMSEGRFSNGFWCVNYQLSDNSIILCVINMSTQIAEKPTYLGLVRLSTDNKSTWKDINTEDLTRKENKEIKQKFESEILDKLGEWRKPHFWE